MSETFPPGHFYSAIPDVKEVRRDSARIFRPSAPLHGIDLRHDEQVALFHELKRFYPEMPYRIGVKEHRYEFENNNYGHSDAIVLHSMLRRLRPRRLVEVGSGFSSCVSMDTNELFLGNTMQCTFIDPAPALLRTLLRPDDAPRILGQRVQDVDLAVFTELEANDVLFIDSSHVLKTGSDVNYLLFDVLPILQTGVFIHIHDMFYPFEYPASWIVDLNLFWNELYAVRAFLQFNDAFEIVFWNQYLALLHPELFEAEMPLCMVNPGGSLWLRKRAPASTIC